MIIWEGKGKVKGQHGFYKQRGRKHQRYFVLKKEGTDYFLYRYENQNEYENQKAKNYRARYKIDITRSELLETGLMFCLDCSDEYDNYLASCEERKHSLFSIKESPPSHMKQFIPGLF